MAPRKRARTLSSLSRTLLAEGESARADFKRSPEGVSSDDLVAFANSDDGGEILVGVAERVVDGLQVGIPIGCDVSDAAILQILNKAISCIPPISLNVLIENLADEPILRVSIPSSRTKPHCTPKGIYCRRDGSRNRPLHPGELLKIFLDSESQAFAERFETTAEHISEEIGQLEDTLDSSIKRMGDQLGWAEFQLGDTESTIDTILGYVKLLQEESNDVALRLGSLFRQDERDDPVRNREQQKFVEELKEELAKREDLLAVITKGEPLNVSVTANGKAARELTKADLQKALDDAVTAIRERENLKKYVVGCKAPNRWKERDLERFAAMVAEGDEVAPGVRGRIEKAHVLGNVTYEGALVGTAALKKPSIAYRDGVFKKARSDAKPSDYPFELGWVFLAKEHRNKGQMTKLLKKLLPMVDGQSLFATSRSSNEVMQEMLLQFGFVANGEPYASTQYPDQTVQLFLRPGEREDNKKESA